MDKPKALGRWPNAPLAYLIAEIKFQRVHDFETQLPALVDGLLDDYPLEESSSYEVSSQAGPNGTTTLEPLRDFKNFGSTMGVRLTRGSLALHCTDYDGWTDSFQMEWSKLLDLVFGVLKPRVLLRSSLRCVDLLVPQGDESPDSFLVPGLRPWLEPAGVLGEFEQGNKVSRFRKDDLSLTTLILSRVQGQILLPPTLTAMTLALSPMQNKALQFSQSTGRSFSIMDTDVAHDGARPFDLPKLKAQYDDIHRLSSAAFKAATTTEAKKLWEAL